MPQIDELTLLFVDLALSGGGGLILAATLVGWARSGRWRNPLGHTSAPVNSPTLLHILGVFIAFWCGSVLLLALFRVDTQAGRIVGTHDWFVVSGIDACAKLLAAVLMAAVLFRHPAFGRGPGDQLHPLRTAVVAVAAMLVILPIADVQLRTGQIIWYWLEPTAQQPMHSALEALAGGEWGWWGTLLLAVTAVTVAPLAEELFFRGLLLQALWGYLGHAWLAIVLSGIAFGFIHNQQPQDVLPLITMGVILGYVRVRYRSLVACILIHSLFNARTIVFALLVPELVLAP